MSGEILVAGVDEAGRGPLAGPVVTAAVILDRNNPVAGLDDSKKLTPARRRRLEHEIRERALCWAIADASVAEIDDINILQATMLAMQRAISKLSLLPHRILVDGNRLPEFACPAEAVVGGDGIHAEISAASILAKEERDRRMVALAAAYPQYGFERHKGYPTRAHIEALQFHGATAHHRRSYAPVQRVMAE